MGAPDVKKPRLEDEQDDDAMLPDDVTPPDQHMSSSAGPITEQVEDIVMEAQTSTVSKAAPPQVDIKGKARGKAKGDGGFKENPYTFLSPDDPILQSCMYVVDLGFSFTRDSDWLPLLVHRKQLNLDTHFPASNVLVRNPEGDAVRSLYLTNDIIKAIVQHNDYARLRIINSGTKVFTKQEGGRGMDASFRVLGEGLPVVLPYIDSATIMEGDIVLLKTLLSVYYPLCASLSEPFKSVIEAGGESFVANRDILVKRIAPSVWKPRRTIPRWRLGWCDVRFFFCMLACQFD